MLSKTENQSIETIVGASQTPRILIENPRRQKRVKHGGDLDWVEVADPPTRVAPEELSTLGDALEKLERPDRIVSRSWELGRPARAPGCNQTVAARPP